MKRTAHSNSGGFGTLQLLITLALTVIIGAFAVVSIIRAREHVRLMNSARQFAAYVERARGDAVRRHNAASIQVLNTTSYAVTMDWDGLGTTRTQNFNLEPGVVFTTGEKAVTFNWRGRIASEESFGFSNGRNTVSVGVTGSGDVTFDAQFFHDASLPPVALNGPGSNPTPDANPSPGYFPPNPQPTPVPSPTALPDSSPTPSPTPLPDSNPTPSPTPVINPSPTPAPSPSPLPTPYSSPPSAPCTIVANPESLSIIRNGAATVNVYRNNASNIGTITGTSSNAAQIQVTPASLSVSGASVGSFTVTVKSQSGSVTFSASGCGTKVVPVNVK